MPLAHVLLVNLGTPQEPEEESVREFLLEFLSDPQVIDYPGWFWQPILRGMVLRSRPREVAELYRSIWYERPCGKICPGGGCSPLDCGSRRIAAALRERLGPEYDVDWAYRYGPRSIERGLAAFDDGAPVVVVPLFPQRTCSTSGSIIEEAGRVAAERRMEERVRILEIPADEPGYVRGLAARCRDALEGRRDRPGHLIVSFHGIPKRYDRREGGRYVEDCRRTTGALLESLGWDPGRATLAFQSKFGPEPWLLPATAERIESLPAEGIRRLAVVTPGFLTEGLETLEEIGQRGRESFLESGGEEYAYLPAVEDHEAFVRGLAGRVVRSVAGGAPTAAGRPAAPAGEAQG